MTIRRVFMLVRSLRCGGAEHQVVVLARALAARGVQVSVATYYPGGALLPRLEGVRGVRVFSLDKSGRWDVVGFLARIRRAIRRERPDVVYGVSSCGGLFATAATAGLRVPAVWTLRGSRNPSCYRDPRGLLLRVAARLSRRASAIVVNSHRGLKDYAELGFARERLVVVPNGLEVDRFTADPAARRRVRAEWGVRDDERLVGRVARFDPVKDYPSFIEAARSVRHPRVRFVAVGGGPPERKRELAALVEKAGLGERWIWAGRRDDMAAVYSAFDLACSSSRSEGCPNVVAEAMACGLVCVVTDAGDSARLVGSTGLVVPVADSAALARAIERGLRGSRRSSGERARRRIADELGVPRLVDRTLDVFRRSVGA